VHDLRHVFAWPHHGKYGTAGGMQSGLFLGSWMTIRGALIVGGGMVAKASSFPMEYTIAQVKYVVFLTQNPPLHACPL